MLNVLKIKIIVLILEKENQAQITTLIQQPRRRSSSSQNYDSKEIILNNSDNYGRGGHNNKRGGRNQNFTRARRVEQTDRESEDDSNTEQGKIYKLKNLKSKNYETVEFIADSGATEHIVNKTFILPDFKVSKDGVIKSANKNKVADIMIDGRGDLLLKSNSPAGSIIKLSNVIAAKDISENLLSLRKLVDAGFCINLDNKIFRVYDKITNKTIFTGVYEKPNWIVRFEVKKEGYTENSEFKEYDYYSCKARIVMENELPIQSQTSLLDHQLINSEYVASEDENTELKESEIGRENSGKLIYSNSEKSDLDEKMVSDWHASQTALKTIKIDELDVFDDFDDTHALNPFDKTKSNAIKDEGMLWHIRLGHASLNYLKKLQTKEKILEKVKFNETIKECETCILSKMEKLPFLTTRKRAFRPLQLIH